MSESRAPERKPFFLPWVKKERLVAGKVANQQTQVDIAVMYGFASREEEG